MRLGVQKPLSDPFNVSLDQGIGLEGIKAALRRIIKAGYGEFPKLEPPLFA